MLGTIVALVITAPFFGSLVHHWIHRKYKPYVRRRGMASDLLRQIELLIDYNVRYRPLIKTPYSLINMELLVRVEAIEERLVPALGLSRLDRHWIEPAMGRWIRLAAKDAKSTDPDIVYRATEDLREILQILTRIHAMSGMDRIRHIHSRFYVGV